jgi:hypothetical protein
MAICDGIVMRGCMSSKDGNWHRVLSPHHKTVAAAPQPGERFDARSDRPRVGGSDVGRRDAWNECVAWAGRLLRGRSS